MNHQRKRFNYLSIQQRALNSSNIPQTSFNSKVGSIVSSNTKSQHDKQYPNITQSHTGLNQNSSIKKPTEPLSQLKQNIAQLDKRGSASKVLGISNKQNVYMPTARSSVKDQKNQLTYLSSNTSQLQNKIIQLENENSLLLKETEEKFLQMQKHLEKVQSILKEKQTTLKEKQILIQNLTNKNKRLDEQNQRWSNQSKIMADENKRLIDQNNQILSSKIELTDEKEELLRIIADKNNQITRANYEIQEFSKTQSELWAKINTLSEQNQKLNFNRESLIEPLKLFEEIDAQTQFTQQQTSDLPMKKLQTIQIQTDLRISELQQMIERCEQFQIDSKLNYRQKYQSLFKKALQMEDEIYKLKEQLFDSQSQVKTIQQQFNTYKIFNQIEKIHQKI